MKTSESISEITKALIKFQNEVENPKNTMQNPHFKNRYAPLEVVLNEVRPKLASHGVLLLQNPSVEDGEVVINTRLIHESGEWIEFKPLNLKIERNTAQGVGATITYGRRYALSTILGISSEEDDDGNYASNAGGKKTNKKPNKKFITKDQAKSLFALGNQKTIIECLKILGYASSTEIEQKDYRKVVEYIKEAVEMQDIAEEVEETEPIEDEGLDEPLPWDEVEEVPFNTKEDKQ